MVEVSAKEASKEASKDASKDAQTGPRERATIRAGDSTEPVANPLWQQLAMRAQAKLTITAPDDPLEQEADRVAESVSQTALAHPREEDEVQTTGPQGEPLPSSDGNPLPVTTRAFMESRLGADLSRVRLHVGSEAAQLNRAVRARAFTHGRDIFLGEGSDNLESSAGRRLLAHELTHTIQQGAARTRSTQWGLAETSGELIQRQVNPDASNAVNLDQEYRTAVQMGDWQAAAEWLNGFSRIDIQNRLAVLTSDKVASLHQGALDNPAVGPQSQVAELTDPGRPPASTAPPSSSRAPRAASAVPAAPRARQTIAPDTEQVPGTTTWPSDDYKQGYQDGAKGDDPHPGPRDGAASTDYAEGYARGSYEFNQRSASGGTDAPNFSEGKSGSPEGESVYMGGNYDDYKGDPDYIDNFTGAAYDPFSKTLHVFFADGGEAIVTLPLERSAGQVVLVFERKSLLISPGPRDRKIYPTIFNKYTLPNITQWLADQAEEIQQSDLLLQAGTGTLQARSLPPDLWWMALLAPASSLGARLSAQRMRPSFGTLEPEPGETPVIRTPTPRGGAVAEEPTTPVKPANQRPPSAVPLSPVATPATTAAEAEALIAKVRSEHGRIVYNVGGRAAPGEPANAININDEELRGGIPNQVLVRGENMDKLLPPGSGDEVWSRNLVGDIDWGEVARAAKVVVKPGHTVTLSPWGGQLGDLPQIKAAMEAQGFRNVRVEMGVVVKGER